VLCVLDNDAYDDFYVSINLSFVSFASSASLWTPLPPLRCHRHTCTISSLYGVTGVHSKEAHVALLNHTMSHLKTLIPTELLNNLMIIFLLTKALGT
jgi:hypothetical protein